MKFIKSFKENITEGTGDSSFGESSDLFDDGKKGNIKQSLIKPSKIEIRKGEWGYGVFATEFIKAGEIVEETIIMSDSIPRKSYDMFHYRFNGIDPISGEKCYKLIGGLMISVNHSKDKANCTIYQDNKWERVAGLKALTDIEENQELYWNYGYNPQDYE
jgi:SET domain-containing protein